jgi:hypothetical protein
MVIKNAILILYIYQATRACVLAAALAVNKKLEVRFLATRERENVIGNSCVSG